ncbi:MAG: hypothetical protein WAU45_00270 [Blastocatellia bacterium]
MKKLVSVLLPAVLLVGGSITAIAHTRTPSINNRERRQQKRIRHGVRTGALTKTEAARLEKQQATTHAIEAKAKSDGKVTARERVRIQHREDRNSRHIYRQKHDSQNRR